MRSIAVARSFASRLVLGLLFASVVVSHGESHDLDGHGQVDQDTPEYPPTYFSHPEHAALIYAHIVFMTLGWVFALPVAVMLSLVKSRYTLTSQLAFLALNAVGLVIGVVYNSETPDLYPNNAHHRVGWVACYIISAQVIVSLLRRIAGAVHGDLISQESHSFLQVSSDMGQNHHHCLCSQDSCRSSNDSGHGSEPTTASLRSNSLTIFGDADGSSLPGTEKEYDDELPIPSSWRSVCSKFAERAISSRIWRIVEIIYQIVDRIVLPLGFIAFATGIITYGRFFEGRAIFNGLAHWIKGGVFFWLGLFSLGRWSGSFGEVGWAWNLRPKQRPGDRWVPSAEFLESALIFFYGSTNIFLEHLSSTDGTWSPTDLEHLSITILFLGGGLCGMLVESTRIRELLNTTAVDSCLEPLHGARDDERHDGPAPLQTYEVSLNPIPALVILLLGIMMGGHHQQTMISTMVHKQWGDLLLGASCARGLTYLLIYLKPPKSVHPSRPPTELLTSFGLMAGGIIFMASSSDVIQGMIHYDLDAMLVYTVTLGLVGFLMAWTLIALAIKGWAFRKERHLLFDRFRGRA